MIIIVVTSNPEILMEKIHVKVMNAKSILKKNDVNLAYDIVRSGWLFSK